MSEWIRISDRLPPAETPVWLYDGLAPWVGAHSDVGDGWLFGNSYGMFWWDGAMWQCDNECDDDYQVTHWMPLPELPEN